MLEEILDKFHTLDPMMASLLNRDIDFLFIIHLPSFFTSLQVIFKIGTEAEKMLFVSLAQLYAYL